MRIACSLLAVLSLSLGAGGLAMSAPALDSAGKCRENGKFVDAKLCATKAADRCRDIKTKKFAKCGTPGTEPVPVAKDAAPAGKGPAPATRDVAGAAKK